MDKPDLSLSPCMDVARKMAAARETLANSASHEEKAAAMREFEHLQLAIAETQFFSEGCLEPGELGNPTLEFRSDY
jgi:hypothetical protein